MSLLLYTFFNGKVMKNYVLFTTLLSLKVDLTHNVQKLSKILIRVALAIQNFFV